MLSLFFCAPFFWNQHKKEIPKMIKAFWRLERLSGQGGIRNIKGCFWPMKVRGERENRNTIALYLPFMWSSRKILFPLWRTLPFLTCLGKNQWPMGQAPLPEIRTSLSGKWHLIHTSQSGSYFCSSWHGEFLITREAKGSLKKPNKSFKYACWPSISACTDLV